MPTRLDYLKHSDPEPLQALMGLSGYLHATDIDPVLFLFIQLRASQLNGCAYCIDMHTKDLLALDEPQPRIYLLPAWRETEVYSPAERAALAWTEAVTQLPNAETLDECYAELARHYGPEAITRLTYAILSINSWNRLSVAFGRKVGAYKPGDLDGMLKSALARLQTKAPASAGTASA